MTIPDPATAASLSQLGLDLLASRKPAEAVRSFRAAIAADSACFEAYYGLVRALREAGRLEQSVGAALAWTALNPADPRAHAELSDSLRSGGHIAEADRAATRARVLEWKRELQSEGSKP